MVYKNTFCSAPRVNLHAALRYHKINKRDHMGNLIIINKGHGHGHGHGDIHKNNFICLVSSYSYLVSAMASFEKYLTKADVEKQVAIPSDFIEHLPDYEGGRTITFPVRDVSGNVWENFGYYIRREGNDYAKPVFQKDWRNYVRDKKLRAGDKIIFRVVWNRVDGSPIYTIAAQKKIELLGSVVWTEEF